VLVNLAASEVGWFACAYGAANGKPWLGPMVVLALVLVHIRLARRPAVEIRLILSAVLIGLAADSFLAASGLVSYSGGNWISGFAPYWILAMWALFATTLNVSMKWMRGRTAVAVLLGAAGGPLAYIAGEKLGAIRLEEPVPALIALGVIWAAVMPLLLWLATRMDGISEVRKPGFIHDDWRVSSHA
jgi:hypothetical protein